MLGVSLEDGRVADFERAGDGGGEARHFARLQNLGGSIAENADGFRFPQAARGQQNGNGRIRGAGALKDFADIDAGKAFGTGDHEIDRTAAEIVEEFAAILGELDIQREPGVARRLAYGMTRQGGTPQHQHSRDGVLSHGDDSG